MEFYYGRPPFYKDITKLVDKDIPASDEERARLFGDPCYGKVKHIIYKKDGHYHLLPSGKSLPRHGNVLFDMIRTYLTPSSKVLAIGFEAAPLIKSLTRDLVILDPTKTFNQPDFNIEYSLISKEPLYIRDFLISSEALSDWEPVPITSLIELETKYHITFDTLVINCHRTILELLESDPLPNIKLIILESGIRYLGKDIGGFEITVKTLKELGFVPVFTKHWTHFSDFYQTWIRK